MTRFSGVFAGLFALVATCIMFLPDLSAADSKIAYCSSQNTGEDNVQRKVPNISAMKTLLT
jgi:hypothetical protein